MAGRAHATSCTGRTQRLPVQVDAAAVPVVVDVDVEVIVVVAMSAMSVFSLV